MQKKSIKDDKLYLLHIRDAIKQVKYYLKDKDYNHFLDDEMMYDAIIRQLAVIGEATNYLSKQFRKNNPQLPYKDIIGMRNFLVHEYFNIKKDIIWETCKENLKELERVVKENLKLTK